MIQHEDRIACAAAEVCEACELLALLDDLGVKLGEIEWCLDAGDLVSALELAGEEVEHLKEAQAMATQRTMSAAVRRSVLDLVQTAAFRLDELLASAKKSGGISPGLLELERLVDMLIKRRPVLS